MKIAHRVIAVLEVLAGVYFLANVASDIQLGFGLLLTFAGLLALI